MRSIASHIDPASLAAQIKMERQVHKGSFLLVEGSTDVKRIDKFVDESACSIVNCFGKPNVVETIEMMQDVGLEDCLGLIDADFDRIRRKTVTVDGVVSSAYHDFDLDHALTEVIDRYLMEVADEPKLAAKGGCRPCVNELLVAIEPLSTLRYANEIRKLRYNLQRIDLDLFFDGERVDIDRMIDSVSAGAFGAIEQKAALRAHIDELMKLDLDLYQLTNGHDFIAALGIALRDRIGCRKVPQTWRSEVELHLRFGLSQEDFSSTYAFAEIQRWEIASGFQVLKH